MLLLEGGVVNQGDRVDTVVEKGGLAVLVKKSGRSGTPVVVVVGMKGGLVTGVVLGPRVVLLLCTGRCVLVVVGLLGAPSHMTCFTTIE